MQGHVKVKCHRILCGSLVVLEWQDCIIFSRSESLSKDKVFWGFVQDCMDAPTNFHCWRIRKKKVQASSYLDLMERSPGNGKILNRKFDLARIFAKLLMKKQFLSMQGCKNPPDSNHTIEQCNVLCIEPTMKYAGNKSSWAASSNIPFLLLQYSLSSGFWFSLACKGFFHSFFRFRDFVSKSATMINFGDFLIEIKATKCSLKVGSCCALKKQEEKPLANILLSTSGLLCWKCVGNIQLPLWLIS